MASPLLVAERLGKTYGTVAPTRALFDVSFEVAQGEFASVVGQSGSGKSTLLNLLGLLDTPTEGTVRYEGSDGSALPAAKRAELRNRLIGFIFQFHHLLPEFSVFENVVMPAVIGGKDADDRGLLEVAEETLEALGLGGLGSKNANELSGGQKQRVAIARAMVNRPRLVLADEPTGNLDTANRTAVYEIFRRLNRELGTTFIIVTHDRGIAQQTDRILEVTDGVLTQDVRNLYLVPGAEKTA